MGEMNELFKKFFPENPPVRTTTEVIQRGLVQLQVTAVR